MKTVKKPVCIKCDRGTRNNPASLAGNEPFYLIPSEIVKDGLYEGKHWNTFCGKCLRKLLGSNEDFSNLIPKGEFQIIIEENQVSIHYQY